LPSSLDKSTLAGTGSGGISVTDATGMCTLSHDGVCIKQQNGAVQSALPLDNVDRAPSDHFVVRDLKAYWLSKLSHEPRRFGLEELVELLAETGCYISPLQSALGQLIAEGKARNLDAKGRRRTNYVDFDKREHLVLCESPTVAHTES
jgi:hypothetical protein